MRFLVDANLPRSTAAILRMPGHEVEFARDMGLAAALDREISARAKGNAAALLTRDLDFASIREYPPEDYAGIIVLRLRDDLTARAIGVAVERFVRGETFLVQFPIATSSTARQRLFEVLTPPRIRPRTAIVPTLSSVGQIMGQITGWSRKARNP